jgi:hypothetical protein
MIGDFADRMSGPMHMRLVMQPVMASLFGFRDGRADVRDGHRPWLSSVGDRRTRSERLAHAWGRISRIFVMGFAMDCAYQLIDQHTLYPGESLIIASILAILPYVIVRDLTHRLLAGRSQTQSG